MEEKCGGRGIRFPCLSVELRCLSCALGPGLTSSAPPVPRPCDLDWNRHHCFSWASALQMAGHGVSQSPEPREPASCNKSVSLSLCVISVSIYLYLLVVLFLWRTLTNIPRKHLSSGRALSAAETSPKVAGGYVLTAQPTARQHITSCSSQHSPMSTTPLSY